MIRRILVALDGAAGEDAVIPAARHLVGGTGAVVHSSISFDLTQRSEEASVVNEQNALTIRGELITVVCRQIAGVLARRIVCWKRAGEHVDLGERFGLIKFSSRTDVLLPPEVEVTVRIGDRVRGGASVIGRIRA